MSEEQRTAATAGKGAGTASAPLPSWRDGAGKQSIREFVQRVTDTVPAEERIADFDNDGTLWCEKPTPIQLDFIVRRLVVTAEQDPALRTRQPWQAAYTRDYDWFNSVLVDHYHGDDSGVTVFAVGVLTAFADITVEEFEAQADRFLRTTDHPTLGRKYLTCSYAPMIELLDYLEDDHGTGEGSPQESAAGGGSSDLRTGDTAKAATPPTQD